jgi:hypothetical protein
MSYADGTSVSVEKSKLELEKLLVKHGAKQYGTAHDDQNGRAIVHFKMSERLIRLQIPVPPLSDYPNPKNAYPPKSKIPLPRGWHWWTDARRETWVREQWEQASRTRWRCMLLIVKAKLEHIALGLSDVEHEFLADIAMPNGRSIAELLKPAIAQAYLDGRMPPLLGPAGVVDGELEP